MPHDAKIPRWSKSHVNLAQPRLGASIVQVSDDFFADKERLIAPSPPIFIPDKYDSHGKWMDGWETRRRRGEGYDHCIIKLGNPGHVVGVEIDTRYFTGNYPQAASIDLASDVSQNPVEDLDWHEALPISPLKGDNQHFFPIAASEPCQYIRLNIYPDGGIARLRIYGDIVIDWSKHAGQPVNLAAMENGAKAMGASDEHFGSIDNIIAPGKAKSMADGWETRRRRSPGFDWAIVKLACPGVVEKIEVDTAFFKGNAPYATEIFGALMGDVPQEILPAASINWPSLLPKQLLTPDQMHSFTHEIDHGAPIDHIRLDMIPDGGISRIRLLGRPVNKEPI